MNYILGVVFGIFLSGCLSSEVSPASNKAITTESLQNKSDMQLLEIEDELEEQTIDAKNKELFFLDTQGEILYAKASGSVGLEYKVKQLLNSVLNKTKFPKKSRKKGVYISLEVSDKLKNKDNILSIAQDYIIHKKRYYLSNTDSRSLEVLKRVLKRERDRVYRRSQNISSRKASDVVLFISGTKNKIIAKVIAKNGRILGYSKTNLLKKNNISSQWIEVSVPRNNGVAQVFEVMLKPVTKNDYYGNGDNNTLTDISFLSANNYCKKRLNAELLHPYVFEYARRTLTLYKATNGANLEIMAPYDEEDHEEYYQDGDELESAEGTIVTFNWNNEKYFAVSNLFKSPNSMFRCMRSK